MSRVLVGVVGPELGRGAAVGVAVAHPPLREALVGELATKLSGAAVATALNAVDQLVAAVGAVVVRVAAPVRRYTAAVVAQELRARARL